MQSSIVKTLLLLIVFTTAFLSSIAQKQTRIIAVKEITDEPYSYPSYNRANGNIVAQKKVGSYLQLFLLKKDAPEMQLTSDSADHKHAAISPDGNKIAYTKLINGYSDIHLLTVNDVSDINLTNSIHYSEAHPSWSNDSMIVFNTNQFDSLQEICSINISSKEITRLTFNKEEDTYGSVSPDGSKLVYTKWFNNEKNAEIYLLSFKDKKETRITNNEIRDVAPVWLSDSVITYSSAGGIYFYQINTSSTTKLISDQGIMLHTRGVAAGTGTLLCEQIKERRAAGLVLITYNTQ